MTTAIWIFLAFSGLFAALVILDSAVRAWRDAPHRIQPQDTTDKQIERLARRIDRANRK
jgi:hypothetical protein